MAVFAVRPALPSEINAVARIHVSSWQRAYRGQIPDAVLDALDPSERARKWIEWLGKAGHGLQVALHDDAVVGFCSLIRSRDSDAKDDVGEVGALYVDPACWRSGAGTALMSAAIAEARAAGYRAVTLWVLTSNTSARHFYEHVGFTPDGGSKVETIGGHALAHLRYRRDVGSGGEL